MLDVRGQNVENLRQKRDAVEDFRGSVQAPDEQLCDRDQSVGAQHVISVFAQSAENAKNFNRQLQNYTQTLDFIFGADENSFAEFNQDWNELEFSKEVQICLLSLLKHFYDFFTSVLKAFIVNYIWLHLLFQFHT